MGKNLIGSKYKGIDRQKDKEEDQKQIQEDGRKRPGEIQGPRETQRQCEEAEVVKGEKTRTKEVSRRLRGWKAECRTIRACYEEEQDQL